MAVDTTEDAPDEIPRVTDHQAENRVERDAYYLINKPDIYRRGVSIFGSPGPHPNVPIAKPDPYGPRMSVVIK